MEISTLLANAGIDYRDKGNYILVRCPFHKETAPSLAIYLDSLTYYCFGCKKYGRYEFVLSKLLNIDPLLLSTKLDGVVVHRKRKIMNKTIGNDTLNNFFTEGRGIANTYLVGRGIQNPEVFKCGFDYLSERVVIPVFFGGKIVGFESRATNLDDTYKYKAHYFEKTNYIFGWDLLNKNTKRLIITESSISAMYLLNTLKLENSVAFMGTVITDRRIELLKSLKDFTFFIWFDWDEAGKKAASKLLQYFPKSRIIISKKDPDEVCSLDEVIII